MSPYFAMSLTKLFLMFVEVKQEEEEEMPALENQGKYRVPPCSAGTPKSI